MFYLLNLMHFLRKKHQPIPQKERYRETNENQSRRQKGIDGTKLIADGFCLKGTKKKAKQQTSQCQEWKAKSNKIANEREKR